MYSRSKLLSVLAATGLDSGGCYSDKDDGAGAGAGALCSVADSP